MTAYRRHAVIMSIALLTVSLFAAGSTVAADRRNASRQLRERYPDSRPMPFPKVDPDRERGPRRGTLVTRDLITGETREFQDMEFDDSPGHETAPDGQGIAELIREALDTGTIPDKNFNLWSEVADPTTGTYPRRVRIWARYRDSNGILRGDYTSSGTLIDSRHVITAAHCMFKLDDDDNGWIFPGGWAEEVTVAPAYENGNTPFGTADATQLNSWSNYTVFLDADHDIGVITLDRPIGALTGWWGYGYNTDYDYFGGGTWRHEGYPAEDPFDGETMWENAGNFDETPVDGWDYRLGFFSPSWGGSSGSGAMRDGDVYAVLSGSDRATHTEDVMLTPTKFGHIGGWIAGVTPSSFDLIPLAAQASSTVVADQNLGSFGFLLHNYSSASATGDWDYTLYLSTDATISPADTQIGSGSFYASLTAKGSQWINLNPPHIPAFIAAGDYFVGVYLNISDANNTNNASSDQEAAPVTVLCAQAPAAPLLTSPADHANCRARDNLYLSWSDAGVGDEYEFQLGTSPGTGGVQTVTAQNHTYQSGLAASTNYYWRVRAKLGCGPWGNWSASRQFRTEPNPYLVSTVVQPADGALCEGSTATLQWAPLPDAATYDVQVSPVWCYEGPITTGITGTQLTLTGLDPNTTYYWRVRSQSICGEATNWSSVPGFCWTFKTAPTAIGPPIRVGPGDGTSCGSSQTALHWNHAEDWDHYEVQIGTSCAAGPIYNTVSNGYTPPGLVSGEVYFWRVRTFHACGLVSDWTDCWNFSLDLEPPTNPTTLASNSHQVETWSTDNTIDTWWDWGWDNCAGSWPQYATLWDQSPTTEPTEPTTSGELTLETSPPLPDGQNHWFHVRTVDWADNLAVDTMHLGPFWIDTTSPSAVSTITTCEPINLQGDFADFTAAWDPATDATSGLAGYSHVLDPSPLPGIQPDGSVDTVPQEVSLPMGDGIWYFRILAVDRAGNTGVSTGVGPFLSVSSLPAILNPSCGETLTEGEFLNVAWESVPSSTGGRLKLSVDGGGSFTTIAELSSTELFNGYFPWVVPYASSTQALLMLEVDTVFNRYQAAGRFFNLVAVSAAPDELPVAAGVVLEGNYPNPFNPSTTLTYSIGYTTDVRLDIIDTAGQRVRTLVAAAQEGPRRYEVKWDGRNDQGLRVASGVYFYRLSTPEQVATRSLVLLK